ncbi:hypothetical protein [Corynebacterium parakroppenstedtii]|uniref:hypothetical protein n=1 Tax=Corynebacterium parakroppenstedtii TaxID=2828363 RepID=UPI0030EEE778
MEYKYTDRDSYGEFSPSTLIDRLESAGVLPHELANVFTQASNAVLNVSDDARSNVEQALSTLANEAESGQKVKDTLRANLETALEEPDPLKKVADFKTAADELVDGLENQLKDLGLGDVSALDDVRSSVRDFVEALDTLSMLQHRSQRLLRTFPAVLSPVTFLRPWLGCVKMSWTTFVSMSTRSLTGAPESSLTWLPLVPMRPSAMPPALIRR